MAQAEMDFMGKKITVESPVKETGSELYLKVLDFALSIMVACGFIVIVQKLKSAINTNWFLLVSA